MQSTSERRAMCESADRFIRDNISADIARMEAERQFDWALMEDLADFGLIGATLPVEGGGLGLGYQDLSALMETMGYHWLSLRALLNVVNMTAQILHAHGNADLHRDYLAPLLTGKKRVFVAITEPDHGSDVQSARVRAVDCGDHFKISGNKQWITNGGGDFGILLCRVAEGPNGPGGLTTLLLDKTQSDYEVHRLKTMVLRATETTAIGFDETIVPKENLIGQVGSGLRTILTTLSHGRVSVASGAVGAAQSVLDQSVEYAKTRKQFGRLIGEQQLVQEMIADMVALTRSARWLCHDAAERLDSGETARLETSLAKRQATEWAHEVASIALQLHGGSGYSEELPLERMFRDTRGGTIPEGTTQIQTLVIGRELLGLDAFNVKRT